ncbi:hypothetical protein [Ilumatobacter nonamiensis]|uniref:hypothetical protein n=1 Tax=Ilumatobacter nonamiensis TaxID=467093 RepID=UPI0003484502|nr:hypothetical protein [Ilumatobacter nonamiensis]
MPWCEDCAKYYTPNSVNTDGSCPQCGEILQLGEGAEHTHEEGGEVDESTPWHFKLMVVAVVTYLGWRLIQLFA